MYIYVVELLEKGERERERKREMRKFYIPCIYERLLTNFTVFQMIVMVVGMIAIILGGCVEVGGLDKVFSISHQFGRTQLFE
jgi:hypothetical protein